jgi:hypothetical protein
MTRVVQREKLNVMKMPPLTIRNIEQIRFMEDLRDNIRPVS